jgi:phytoene dehydrogenase-like protein
MPKKRVGVSLRKPSPAPETVPESAAAPAVSADVVASDAAIDRAPSTVVMSSDTAASERPSDIVALREALPAPAPAEARAIEAFVNGAAAAIDKVATAIPSARLAEVLQRGFEGYRELVLYLPEKLAERLSLYCLEHNLDMSRLVATAIDQHLNGATSAAPVEARRGDDAPANEGLLSLAARLLMGELAAWARAVWVRRRSASAVSTPAN